MASVMDSLDKESRLALMELQGKMVDLQSKMNIAQVRQRGRAKDMQRLGLTAKEIDSMPKEVRMYESVGRMFVLQDKESILDGLESELQHIKTDLKQLASQNEFLEKQWKDSEGSVRDILGQKVVEGASKK